MQAHTMGFPQVVGNLGQLHITPEFLKDLQVCIIMDIQDFSLEDWGPQLGEFVFKSLDGKIRVPFHSMFYLNHLHYY